MNNQIIDIALKEVGYTEMPANSNKTKYGAWFGFDGVPWCAMFVSWCYHHAGYPLGNIGFTNGFCGCQTGFDHWKKTGEITTTPVKGDIVLFDWNGDMRYDHTGLFIEHHSDGYFKSVEGNTSASNQSNGGEVQVRIRKYAQAIFIHPRILDGKSESK
jgi:hypothetical protein